MSRGIDVTQVDERGSSWEDDAPRFRVYLHGSGADETHGWTDTYDATGANVLQVIDWAQRQAGDRLTYAVALVRDQDGPDGFPGHERGLVWLLGIDGNDTTDGDPTAYAAHRAMSSRRGRPATIPGPDRAPPELPSVSHTVWNPSDPPGDAVT